MKFSIPTMFIGHMQRTKKGEHKLLRKCDNETGTVDST